MVNAHDARAATYDAIGEALCLEQNAIFDDADIERNLGAESIDMLDIRFKVEKNLGITITGFHARLAAKLEEATPPYRSMPGTPARIMELIERDSSK